MPYQRQHFVNGNRLFAEQLTHIEDGLIHLDERIDKMIEEGVEMDIGLKWENIEDVPETFPPEEHNHDETYAPKEHEHSQYLTQHQDISGKANVSDLTSHTGNTTAHITAAERTKWNSKAEGTHTHSEYLPLTGGLLNGSLKFQDVSLPQKAPEFICGIDAFAAGGEMGWQSKAEFLAGYAKLSDIPTLKTETWTFTLENGSTVTKVVYVG